MNPRGCGAPPRSPNSCWRALPLALLLMCTACVTMGTDSGGGPLQPPWSSSKDGAPSSAEPSYLPDLDYADEGEGTRLHRRRGSRTWVADADREELDEEEDTPLVAPEVALPSLPSGWPEVDSKEKLAALLACTTPACFMALQRQVDMPALLEELDFWDAVNLSTRGPLVSAAASEFLTRKRAELILKTTELYGVAYAEIFILHALHSAFDDEVRALLRLLAGERQLKHTLALMDTVQKELEWRGLKLADHPDRDVQAMDVLRGLGRAARDAANTIPVVDGGGGASHWLRAQGLPPPYLDAYHQVVTHHGWQLFQPGHVVQGSFDSMTFGVPLGFYSLVVGTGEGLGSLLKGEYEDAARQLAPALTMVALYTGTKAVRGVAEARASRAPRLSQARLRQLTQVAERLREQLGGEGLEALARHIQASREAAVFVGAGGEPAALALHAARGNVAQAQAWLSKARPQRPAPSASGGARARAGKAAEGLGALVDEAAGLSLESLQARLGLVETEAQGPRLPARVEWLRQRQPTLESPPPGAQDHPRWGDYVDYRHKRLGELEQGLTQNGPLEWGAYSQLWGVFTRGLEFQRTLAALLRADAALPRAQRKWLQDFNQPRVETNVGVTKPGVPGVRYVDVLVIEEAPAAGQAPRVEVLSCKSRDLSLLTDRPLRTQMRLDAEDALRYYGGTLNVRRPSLNLREKNTSISKVRLIYEGGALKPSDSMMLRAAVQATELDVRGVEVSFQ